MGKKRIGDFIRGINFLKLTKEQGDEFGNKMIDIESQINYDNDGIQIDEVKDGFAAFAEKVGVPKFPELHSGGYLAAHSAIDVLIRLVGELEHDEAVSKAFGKVYADTWLALLKAGPSSAQTEIMSTFQTYIFEQYIMNCEHKQFSEMFSQMKVTFHYDASIEKGHEEREYADFVHKAISYLFERMEEKQLIESRKEFLDLYHHFQKQLSGLSETFATYVGYLLRDMASGFPNENPYGETKGVGHADPKSSKESIELVKSMICDPKIKSQEDIGKFKAGATLEGVIEGMFKADDIPGMIDPLMSLVSEFSKSAGSPFGGEIYATVRDRLFNKMDVDSYVPNVKVYESCLGMVLDVLPHPNVTEPMADMIKFAFAYCLMKFQDMTQPLAKKFVTAMIELLKSGNIILVKITVRILRDDDMLERLKWKSLIEEVKMMLGTVGKKPIKEMQKDGRDKLDTIIEGYTDFCDYFLKALWKSKMVDKVQKELIEAIFDCFELESPAKANMAYKLQDDLRLSKPDKDLIMFILTRCKADLANKELKWTIYSSRSISNTLQAVITAYNGNGKMVTPEQHKLFAGIFNICMEGDSTVEHFIDYDECHTVYMTIYRNNLENYYELHRETSTQDCFIDVIPGVLKWVRISVEEDCEQVKDTSFRILQNCSIKAVKGMEKYLKDLMDLMFLSEQYQYLSPLITKLYPDNPNDVHTSLPNLFDRYPMLKDFDQTMVMNLMVTVSTTHPEAFTDQQIKSLVDWHLDASEDSDSLLLIVLRFISEKRPRKLVPHLRSFLKPHKKGHAMMFSVKLYIIGNVGVCEKTLAEESMDFMVSNFGFHDPSVVMVINSMIATLMKASKQYMQKYREHVEKLEKNGTTPNIKD
ncbi:hypothetical protein DPMN_094732 [Dreissena polymorpha]|uniref:Uncharacterized protein n=2 Tax=Dreissena polymorpha TaxID=45954 RepID=A0A9D4L614_DREPO|nr:hypothetical protein DPMN_094732 [Dreissena polymorpha]